jgi:general secretion pathway protein A
MYERFFGLRERPFRLTSNPQYFVLTGAHREAISSIEYGIASRHGITLLIGDAGSGKTTLIRYAMERQPPTVYCVHLTNPALTRPEFVEMLAVRFGLSVRARKSKTALLLELETVLRRRDEAGGTTALIVDEAQSMPFELLEEIRLLANIETEREQLLSVIIAGQPGLAERLDDPSIRQLKQRIAQRSNIYPLTHPQTESYVFSRIRSAGGAPSEVFTREAVTLIHEASCGVPRTINVLADNALLNGLALNQKPVKRQCVEEVCRDFGHVDQGPISPNTPPTVAAAEPASEAVQGVERALSSSLSKGAS